MSSLRPTICSLVLIASFVSLPAVAEDWMYTVRKGDTLWGLCERYTKVKACWLKIGDYNGVKYPRTLAPGTQVRFPVDWLRDPPAPATLAFVSGTVTKRDSQGLTTALNQGDQLNIGEELIVGANSTAVISFADQSLMSVESDSVVRFDVLSKFSATGMVDTRVHLQKGAAQTKVPKRTPRSRFEVSTPSSVAAVRGTDFRVVSSEMLTRNEVFGGEVEVANQADQKDLTKGLGLLAKKDEELGQAVKLLSAAEIALDNDSVLLPYLIDWSDVVDAVSYRFKLLKADQPTHTVFTTQTAASQFRLSSEEVEEGCYIVQVNPVDGQSFQGMPSQKPLCLRTPLAAAELKSLQVLDKGAVRITWSEIDAAARYRLEFSHDAEFATLIDSLDATTNTLDYSFDPRHDLYFRIVSLAEASNNRSQNEKVYQAHAGGRKDEGVFGRILFVLIAIAAIL